MTKKKIKKLAYQKAYEYFFCNVGDDDWPNNPDAFIDKVQEEDCNAEALDLSVEDENGKSMSIWEPFERCRVDEVVELMEDYAAGLIAFYQKASARKSHQKWRKKK